MITKVTAFLFIIAAVLLKQVQTQAVDVNVLANLPEDRNFDEHPCRRECQVGESMECTFKIVVHSREVLGPECQQCLDDPTACAQEDCIYADGVPNNVMTVNNVWPAPAIVVCENDIVIADVVNLLDENTTIHWHGMHMNPSKDMDGAPFITQLPIAPRDTFRYEFPVDRIGTIWYHSHMFWQRALGVAAPFVIRQPQESNPYKNLYDFDLIEHTLMLTDMPYNDEYNSPGNIFINGKGRNHLNSWPDNDERHRYERLQVQEGKRYLWRAISNGVNNCPLEVSIENHRMLVIAADGNNMEPMEADNFFLTSAERLAFIVNANQAPGKYWINVKGHAECAGLYQGAVLEYEESQRSADVNPPNQMQNTPRVAARNLNIISELITPPSPRGRAILINDVPTVGLRSLNPLTWPTNTQFIKFYNSFGLHRAADGVHMQADDITFESPRMPLLLSEDPTRTENVCNRDKLSDSGVDCTTSSCHCTNIVEMPANEAIEIIVTNFMNSTHPYHLHGFSFRLVGQKSLGNAQDLRNIRSLDEQGRLQRLPNDFPAIEKDTVQIPPLGYIIVRFISDNTGYWLYHCHIERHALNGMMGVIHVKETEGVL